MTDEEFEKFLSFSKEVIIPGEIRETHRRDIPHSVYSAWEGMEFRVTIEPHWPYQLTYVHHKRKLWRFWRRQKHNIAMAIAIAILATLATLFIVWVTSV